MVSDGNVKGDIDSLSECQNNSLTRIAVSNSDYDTWHQLSTSGISYVTFSLTEAYKSLPPRIKFYFCTDTDTAEINCYSEARNLRLF